MSAEFQPWWQNANLPGDPYEQQQWRRTVEAAFELGRSCATPAPGAPGQEAAAVDKDSLTTQAAAVAQETDRDWSKAQDWKGMDGATAFLLINRHSDGWGDVGAMMNAWLAANAATPAAVQAVGAKAPIWYMRDNHTFRPLHGGPEEMVAQCLEEFDAGYTCGMLCSKKLSITVHAHGKARRAEFAAAALSALLTAALPPSGAGEKTS